MRNIYLLATVCIVFFRCSTSSKIEQRFEPTFIPSEKTTHTIPEGQEYIFGYLEVLENRNKPLGKTIKLPIYIFKCRNETESKDPIIYTVGGPGSSTMRSAQYMKFYKYLDDRDVILFEQRGTRYAQPSLDCPQWSEAVYLSGLPTTDSAQEDSIFKKAVVDCRGQLQAQGIDLEHYNTNAIAADIADLRKALNIKAYNLLTISYSTKIAQVLMRDYPEGLRSVVMDSPLPLEVNYDEESTNNLMESVTTLLDACAVDPKCNKQHPKLKARFFEFLREKTTNPLVVEVENPQNGSIETFYLKGKDLILVFSMAGINDLPNVPIVMEGLLSGEYGILKDYLAGLFAKPESFTGFGIGMRWSVWCTEEFPFTSQDKITAIKTKYPEIQGLSPAVFEEEICKIWSVKPANKKENLPIKSDIPTLLISGEYDSETPVKWAKSMQKNLINSHHLIFQGWRHTPTTNWGNSCAMQAANEFFNSPEVKPSPDCFGQIGGIEF